MPSALAAPSLQRFADAGDAARRFAALLLLLCVAGCATIDLTGVERTPSHAYAAPTATRLGKAIAAEAAQHAGQSAFRVVESGLAGFAARMALIDAAERSVDLQYYIMDGATADLVAERLLAAADRGVRVRVLLDDHGEHPERTLAALAAHRNIEVRIFNPVLMRGPATALSVFEYLVRGAQLDRRMHNKLFAVDNAIAIIGGRNIGDAYFDAPGPVDFEDLDLVVAGPIVPVLSASFDEYWNSPYAVPLDGLLPAPPSADEIARVRQSLADLRQRSRDTPYARAVKASRIARDVADGRFTATWAHARVLVDSPRKVDPLHDDGTRRIADELIPALAAVTRDLAIVSPYVIPGDAEMAAIRTAKAHGARVRILTNSLATNDTPIAHAGYAKVRGDLVDAGVELYELKPLATPFAGPSARRSASGRSSGGSSGGSGLGSDSGSRTALHAKVIVLDDRFVFLTSMNLDPRSIRLNTEIGLWIDSPALAAQILRRFDEAAKPQNSFRVVRSPSGNLEWITATDGVEGRYDDEPDTTVGQRLRSRLQALLPIQGQL